jgi:hypothetical protein
MSGVNISPAAGVVLTPAFASIAAATDTALVAAAANKIVRVYRVLLLPSAANNITFEDSALAALGPLLTFSGATNSTPTMLDYTGEPWFVTGAGLGFSIKTSTGAPTGVQIWFTQMF